MSRNKKIIFILITVTLLLVMALRNKIQPSYIDVILNQKNIPINLSTYEGFMKHDGVVDVDFGMYRNDIDTIEELAANADLIVIGSLHNRVQEGSVFNTEINIIDTIKGTCSDQIKIFEPAYVIKDPVIGDELTLKGSYVPIVNNESYLFFLHKENVFEHEQYNLVSSYFGKFRIGETVKIKALDFSYNRYLNINYQDYDFVDIDITELLAIAIEECTNDDICERADAMRKYDEISFEQIWIDAQIWLENKGSFK